MNYSRSLPTTCCFTLKGSQLCFACSVVRQLLRKSSSESPIGCNAPSIKQAHNSPGWNQLKAGRPFFLLRHSSEPFIRMLASRIRKRSVELVSRCSTCTKREKEREVERQVRKALIFTPVNCTFFSSLYCTIASPRCNEKVRSEQKKAFRWSLFSRTLAVHSMDSHSALEKKFQVHT